jgi:hypothetical protein
VRVLWVWLKGVAASCLEFAFAVEAWGDVSAVEQALHAASSVGRCQGGSSGGGGGGSHRGRLVAKHPRLPCGSTENRLG